ncbi:MAG: hypothetical protein Q9166_001117 [cf. Caloplaca sp. 2 TL-2023]
MSGREGIPRREAISQAYHHRARLRRESGTEWRVSFWYSPNEASAMDVDVEWAFPFELQAFAGVVIDQGSNAPTWAASGDMVNYEGPREESTRMAVQTLGATEGFRFRGYSCLV